MKLNKDLCRLTRELDVMCETVRTQEAGGPRAGSALMPRFGNIPCRDLEDVPRRDFEGIT